MEVEVERQGGVAIVRLNRPEKYNALDEPMKAQLVSAFAGFARDDGVRAIVLTGNGRAFCAGGDVSTMGAFTTKSIEQRLSVFATVAARHRRDKQAGDSVRPRCGRRHEGRRGFM